MADLGSREALKERLADLIGFEDGVDDVLDHLTSIDAESDLIDYMCQLLGQENETMRAFVKDICKFKRGEAVAPLKKTSEERDKSSSTAPSVEGRGDTESKGEKSTSKMIHKKLVPQANAKPALTRKRVSKNGSNTKVTEKKVDEKDYVEANGVAKKSPLSINTHPDPPQKAAPPPRGKATLVCGCFGTKHKSVTNCLYCGRISCEREGYDYCPFCGFLVQPFGSEGASAQMDAAMMHKERLLKFDREFASRTIILDDQADYFSKSKSAWLANQEREEAAQLEERRLKDLHQRGNQSSDIAF